MTAVTVTFVPPEARIEYTLGDAILEARRLYVASGEPHTVAIAGTGHDAQFCTIPSAAYAKMREEQRHHSITPLVTFRRGGLDCHRDSFRPVERALLNHERF